jgi:5'(3')-deoxyribonucleotidase
MPTIYIDMDGVVADFDTLAQQIMTATMAERKEAELTGRWPDSKWRDILKEQHFYRQLPKMPQADQMMAMASRFRDDLGWRLRMLTAIPRKNDFPEVFQDKIDWMMEYYPGVRVHFGPYSEDKQNHCQPGDILVDDRPSNIKEWRAAGGTAVHVTNNYQLALDQLGQIYKQMVDSMVL